MKLFTFRIQDDVVGIEAGYAFRVLDDFKITPVCKMPPCYLGLLYYRGELFDVIDMKQLLQKKDTVLVPADRLVILRWADKKLAIAPGTVEGLLWIDAPSDADQLFTAKGHPILTITPEWIWDKLTELPYGTIEV